MLNIDNKEIRKKLVKNNTFKITYVPCIIRIDPQGVASQYEANKAFDLIYKFIERSHPPPQQPPQPPPQQPLQPPPQQPLQPKPQSSNTPPQFVFKSKENAPSQTPILPEISTPIDKLLDIEETEEEPNLVIEDRPSHSRATSEKINISSVMTGARRSQENLDENKIKTPPETTIKQVQTGKKINIAEIMSSR